MKVWPTVVALILVLSFSGIADAKARRTGSNGKSGDGSLSGKITELTTETDGATRDIQLSMGGGKKHTTTVVKANATTTITVNGNPGTLDDLKTGDTITFVRSKSGPLAASITVTSGGEKKKKKST